MVLILPLNLTKYTYKADRRPQLAARGPSRAPRGNRLQANAALELSSALYFVYAYLTNTSQHLGLGVWLHATPLPRFVFHSSIIKRYTRNFTRPKTTSFPKSSARQRASRRHSLRTPRPRRQPSPRTAPRPAPKRPASTPCPAPWHSP